MRSIAIYANLSDMRRRARSERLLARAVISVCASFILLMLTASYALATDDVETLTLDKAYSLALGSHEAIKIANEGAMQADASVDKALSQMLPKLTAEGSYTAYNHEVKSGALVLQPEDASRADVRLTQPIYTGGREWAARSIAHIVSSKSKAGQDAAKENVIRLTAMAYFGVLKAEREVEIKTAALKRAEERRKVAAARLKVGEVTKAALLRAESLAAGATAGLTKASGDLKNAWSFLRRVTGVTGEFKVVDPPVKLMNVPDIDLLIKIALNSRSDYKQTILDERAADEGITYTKSWFMPSLRLEGLYSWREQNPKTTFFQKESVSGSVILSYPIFEGGLRYAELSEARSKFREAEQRRLGLRRDIEVQVREAVDRLEAVSALLESYEKERSFAEEDSRMVSEQFKYGLATIVDVIDADSALVSAESSLMNATYDYELAKLELKSVTGRLLEEAPVNEAGYKTD